jgi:hypothetical protein
VMKRAASLGGCRGETPLTPPCSRRIREPVPPHPSCAHALGRTCTRPHWCRRYWGGCCAASIIYDPPLYTLS